MRLNDLHPGPGARVRTKRVGRGVGSGLGKTAGRGHKGQHARTGGLRKVGFEGGQMPLQRRLPKVGFRSALSRRYAAVRLGDLARLEEPVIDLAVLRRARLVPQGTGVVKVILNGNCEKALTIRGLRVTRGARARIEALGGRVED